jgi:hypothetical protein
MNFINPNILGIIGFALAGHMDIDAFVIRWK